MDADDRQDDAPFENGDKRTDDRDTAGRFAEGNQAAVGHGRPKGPSFGSWSKEINESLASKFDWSARTAKKFKLDADQITVGELMVHAAKVHAIGGKVGYLVEDNARREGKVPEHIRADVTFELTDEQAAVAARIAEAFDALDDDKEPVDDDEPA